jgi:ABC-type transport system involved in cytochrome bd biosynthesis fused ATPase/permease subunit
MKNLIRVIVAYALIVMLWAAFSLALGKNGGNAPLMILVISIILLASSTYMLKITK